jgi:hypothetical protein
MKLFAKLLSRAHSVLRTDPLRTSFHPTVEPLEERATPDTAVATTALGCERFAVREIKILAPGKNIRLAVGESMTLMVQIRAYDRVNQTEVVRYGTAGQFAAYLDGYPFFLDVDFRLATAADFGVKPTSSTRTRLLDRKVIANDQVFWENGNIAMKGGDVGHGVGVVASVCGVESIPAQVVRGIPRARPWHNGVYQGSYRGTASALGYTAPVSGPVQFQVRGQTVYVDLPGAGGGRLNPWGSATFNSGGGSVSGAHFTAYFTRLSSGDVIARGSWRSENAAGTGWGTWSSVRVGGPLGSSLLV